MRGPDETPVERFVERFGVAAESYGWPRIAGKMLAFLLVCEPAEQSLADLQKALLVSKGSVSTMGHFLLERGFIERCSRRGDRQLYVRIAPGVWGRLLSRALASVGGFQALAQEALGLREGAVPSVRARAEEMAEFYGWWAAEAPALLARWEAHRRERA
jgi:hypothetical protein